MRIDFVGTVVVAVIATIIGAIGGYQARGITADAEIARIEAQRDEDMKRLSDAATAAALRAVEIQTALENQVAELDARRSKELQDAKTKADALRAELRAGVKRVSIAGRCATNGSGVSNSTTSTSLGDAAGRAELDPAAAEALAGIAADGDAAIRQLGACQEFIGKILSDDAPR